MPGKTTASCRQTISRPCCASARRRGPRGISPLPTTFATGWPRCRYPDRGRCRRHSLAARLDRNYERSRAGTSRSSSRSSRFFDDWMDRYQYIIDLGRRLPPFPTAAKTDDNRIRGCQSQVWFLAEMRGDRLHFEAISDAAIVSGLIAVLLRIYSDRQAGRHSRHARRLRRRAGLRTAPQPDPQQRPCIDAHSAIQRLCRRGCSRQRNESCVAKSSPGRCSGWSGSIAMPSRRSSAPTAVSSRPVPPTPRKHLRTLRRLSRAAGWRSAPNQPMSPLGRIRIRPRPWQ